MAMTKAGQPTLSLVGRVRKAFIFRRSQLWRNTYWTAFCQDVSEYELPADGLDGVTFRHAQVAELDSLADMARHMGPSARKILAQQFVCPDDITLIGIGTETGKLVYHTWLSYGCPGLEVLGDWAQRPAASLRRVWVEPSWRCRGMATVGCSTILGAATANGVRQAWSFVHPSNTPSLRLHEKLGFCRVGQIHLKARFCRKHLIVRCDEHEGERRIDMPLDFAIL